ncbi:MAG: hypothetical protein WDM80_04985 [Limisphaerales bacterium]
MADLESYVKNAGYPSATGNLAKVPGPGHNAWMMTSTALVLFMTLPGLALFYGGMVRKKNVLSVLAQCFSDYRPRHHLVVALRIQHGFWPGYGRAWSILG